MEIFLLGIIWIISLIVCQGVWTYIKRRREKHSLERGDLFGNILSDKDVSNCLRNGSSVISELLEDDELERIDARMCQLYRKGYWLAVLGSFIIDILISIIFVIVISIS